MTSVRIPRRKPLTARIGVFGVGFHAYWPQFDGLLEELLAKQAVFVEKLAGHAVEVVDFGMVDDAESALRLASEIEGGRPGSRVLRHGHLCDPRQLLV